MSQVETYMGAVTGRSTGTPGPASGITYTVSWNSPTGIRSLSGVAPPLRWPDTFDTIPFNPADLTKPIPVLVVKQGQSVNFLFFVAEQFDSEEC
jgi:hypothetical protein